MNWASDPAAREAIGQLIKTETACLNKGDLESWISLFTDDGYYWMPLEKEHTDPEKHDSLIYDNRALMEMRRHNLASPLAPWGAAPEVGIDEAELEQLRALGYSIQN